MFFYKQCPNCPNYIPVEVDEEGTIEREIECGRCGCRMRAVVELFIYVNEIEEPAKEGDDETETTD